MISIIDTTHISDAGYQLKIFRLICLFIAYVHAYELYFTEKIKQTSRYLITL